MTPRALISKIHRTFSANQKRDSEFNVYIIIFNHTFYETNFKPKLFTAKVECNGTVLKELKTKKTILFKFSLNDGGLVFWFTFNLAVHFRPKMALTLEILSD